MAIPNLNYIKELSAGDLVFEKKIIEIVKEEFPKEKEVYFLSVEKKDYRAIVEIVHKIKHKISIFGLKKSYETAVQYENNLKNEDLTLQEEFEETLSIITVFLASL